MKVFWNGKLLPASKAKAAFAWGLVNGTALAGAIRVEAGKLTRMPGHLQRLREGAKALAMPAPDPKAIKAACLAVIRANRIKSASLRLRYFRDQSLLVLALPLPRAKARQGLDLATSAVRHFGPDALGPRAKSNSMLANKLSLHEVLGLGEEAIRLSPDGMVTELSWRNVLVKRKGRWISPPAWAGLLEGTELEASRKGRRIVHGPLTRSDLYAADEVYVSNSTGKLRKVGRVDGRRVVRQKRV